MTKEELAQGWKNADTLAQVVYNAWANSIGVSTGTENINKETGLKAQRMLRQWIEKIKSEGYVYNGSLDEYLALTF